MLAEQRHRAEPSRTGAEAKAWAVVALLPDLRMLEDDRVAAVRQLRVARQVGGILDHTSRDARLLQLAHHFLRRTLHRPGFDEGIQLVAVLDAPQGRSKARFACPGRLAEDAAKAPPFLIGQHRNGAPAVLSATAIHSMRGGAGEISDHPLVAGTALFTAVHGVIENGRLQ